MGLSAQAIDSVGQSVARPEIDLPRPRIAAQLLRDFRQAQEQLDDNASDGAAARLKYKAIDVICRMQARFGMTPGDRAALKISQPKAVDPFSEWMAKRNRN